MKLLRVLHVGVANRGTWPLKRCNASTGFIPAALVDVDEGALEAARQLTALPAGVCFRSMDEALRAVAVDCVIICTPTRFHVPLAKLAIAAGKPVLVEKGMAPDWASARELAEAVARTPGAVAAVAQNYRYNGMERTFARAVRDPDFPAYLGRVDLVEYTQYRVRPHVGTLSYPFASVWDMSCHHFDTLLSWFGPMARMTAFGWRAAWSPYEGVCNTTAMIEFAGGVRAHYAHTHDAARNVLDIQMHAERGCLSATGTTYVEPGGLVFSARPTEQFGARPAVPVPLESADGESDLLRDFYRYIVEGVEPGISVRNNLETMAACEMMVRSIRLGRPVERSELEAS